jgi:hypothetical protein
MHCYHETILRAATHEVENNRIPGLSIPHLCSTLQKYLPVISVIALSASCKPNRISSFRQRQNSHIQVRKKHPHEYEEHPYLQHSLTCMWSMGFRTEQQKNIQQQCRRKRRRTSNKKSRIEP